MLNIQEQIISTIVRLSQLVRTIEGRLGPQHELTLKAKFAMQELSDLEEGFKVMVADDSSAAGSKARTNGHGDRDSTVL